MNINGNISLQQDEGYLTTDDLRQIVSNCLYELGLNFMSKTVMKVKELKDIEMWARFVADKAIRLSKDDILDELEWAGLIELKGGKLA